VLRRSPTSTPFPYTTLFRSWCVDGVGACDGEFICINRHRSMERDRKLRYAWHGGIREVVAGIRDKWEAASFRKWSRSSRGGKAGRDREFCRERNHGNSIGAHTDAMQ